MNDPAEVCRGLLRKARQDRMALEALLPAQVFDTACFHAQQAVEKGLKAFLAYHSVPFPYTHNLAKLVEVCAGFDPAWGGVPAWTTEVDAIPMARKIANLGKVGARGGRDTRRKEPSEIGSRRISVFDSVRNCESTPTSLQVQGPIGFWLFSAPTDHQTHTSSLS